MKIVGVFPCLFLSAFLFSLSVPLCLFPTNSWAQSEAPSESLESSATLSSCSKQSSSCTSCLESSHPLASGLPSAKKVGEIVFLAALQGRFKQKFLSSSRYIGTVKNCFQKKTPSSLEDFCRGVRLSIRDDISQNYEKMRLYLALSQPRIRADTVGVKDRSAYKFNKDIEHPFSGEGIVSPPLSKEEIGRAKATWDKNYLDSLEDYKERRMSQLSEKERQMGIDNEYIGKAFRRTQSNSYMRFIQETAKANYIETIGDNPLLVYFKSPDPSDQEVVSALNRLQKNGDQVLKFYSQEENALSLMGFTELVDEVLSENPRFCGIANEMWNQYRKKEIVKTVGHLGLTFASISACGLITRGLVSGGCASLLGLGWTSYIINKQHKRAVLSYQVSSYDLQGHSVMSVEEASQAKRGLDTMVGLSVVGSGFVGVKALKALKRLNIRGPTSFKKTSAHSAKDTAKESGIHYSASHPMDSSGIIDGGGGGWLVQVVPRLKSTTLEAVAWSVVGQSAKLSESGENANSLVKKNHLPIVQDSKWGSPFHRALTYREGSLAARKLAKEASQQRDNFTAERFGKDASNQLSHSIRFAQIGLDHLKEAEQFVETGQFKIVGSFVHIHTGGTGLAKTVMKFPIKANLLPPGVQTDAPKNQTALRQDLLKQILRAQEKMLPLTEGRQPALEK